MEQETGYASDDSGGEIGSSSLNANEPPGENYMSQDESYSGNVSVVNVDLKKSNTN
jgi:hypothetical protein